MDVVPMVENLLSELTNTAQDAITPIKAVKHVVTNNKNATSVLAGLQTVFKKEMNVLQMTANDFKNAAAQLTNLNTKSSFPSSLPSTKHNTICML